MLSVDDHLGLEILPTSGPLAVEADGNVAANVAPGDQIELLPRPGAAHVVRLGHTTFYERARRKLGLTSTRRKSPSADQVRHSSLRGPGTCWEAESVPATVVHAQRIRVTAISGSSP